MKKLAPIVITPGEPAGIGPDLILQLAQIDLPCDVVIVADPEVLNARAKRLNLSQKFSVIPVKCPHPEVCSDPNPANANYVLNTLRRAIDGCLRKEFSALVTGPIHKATINEAGISFQGHTEFLATLTQTEKVVMMLQIPGMRVALATTHIPLSKVSECINQKDLEETLRILHRELQKYFGIQNPKILICGLNPHAGESGYLGMEEINIISPVINKLHSEGFNLKGPLPADTLFIPKYLLEADAVLAMYHDQGLPVLKYAGFGQAVNITLGLPFIRTSVDHGTAFDLVGRGTANVGSLEMAIQTAYEMAIQQL